MSGDFYTKIREFSVSAKGARKKVVSFLLHHPEEAAFMTIEGLADTSGVSAGMVSRTVREMGFNGFADMQDQIRKLVRRNITPAARLQRAHHSEGSFRDVVRHEMKNLAAVLRLNTEGTFATGAKMLATAHSVHVMGLRSSFAPAYSLWSALRQIRENVNHISLGTGLLAEDIKRFSPHDVCVIISFPRYLRESLLMAQEAKNAGCSIIAVTDGFSSPLAMQADVTFLAPYESASFFNSPIAAYGIITTLLSQTARILGAKSQEELERLNTIQKRWKVLVDSKDAWEHNLNPDEF